MQVNTLAGELLAMAMQLSQIERRLQFFRQNVGMRDVDERVEWSLWEASERLVDAAKRGQRDPLQFARGEL